MRVRELGVGGLGLAAPETSSVKARSKADAANSEDKKLKQACKDFESIFLGHLLKSMRKTVSKSELMGSSQEEQLFQDMMDDEVCKSAAENNSVGIADSLYKQLSAQLASETQASIGTEVPIHHGLRGENR